MTLKPPGAHMPGTTRVKAVTDMAAGVSVNYDTHPKHYLRSGRELIRSAASYQEDGQTEQSYILYVRFLTIFLDKIRHHPNYKEVASTERKLMSDYCNKILPQAEYLKQELLKKYEKEYAEYQTYIEMMRKQAEEKRQQEIEDQQRLDLLAKEQTKAGILPSTPILPAPSSYGSAQGASNYHQHTTSGTFLPSPFGLATIGSGVPVAGNWVYDDTLNQYRTPEGGSSSPIPGASHGQPQQPIPSVDRSTKPSRVLNPNATGLRPMTIPSDLAPTFLRLAEANSRRNVETCGALTGRISGERLIITDLILPKQTGTSDTCTTLNENEIFDLQDKYNLISFGWIHTHPSQDAFLSSVDMHTQFGYQVMMPEAIGIVCAVNHKQTRVFFLTPDDGMDDISKCKLSGFHPHRDGLFQDATHVTFDSSFRIKVHDIR